MITIDGKAYLREKDILDETGAPSQVVRYIIDQNGIEKSDEWDGKPCYDLKATLEIMSKLPSPDYGKIAAVAEEMCSVSSPAAAMIDRIREIVNVPVEISFTKHGQMEVSGTEESKADKKGSGKTYTTGQVADILGVKPQDIRNFMMRHPGELKTKRNDKGIHSFTDDNIETLRVFLKDAIRRNAEASNRPDSISGVAELARLSGVSDKTIYTYLREYPKELKPTVDKSGHKSFTSKDVEIVKAIYKRRKAELADNARKQLEEINRKKSNRLSRKERGLPSLTKDEISWQTAICTRVTATAEKHKCRKNDVFSNVYTIMRNKYGIVMEQERKEYIENNNLDAGVKISTLELVTTKAQLRSLFKSILADYDKYVKNGKRML